MKLFRWDAPFLRSYLFFAWKKPRSFLGAYWRRAGWVRVGAYLFLMSVLVCECVILTIGYRKGVAFVPIAGVLFMIGAPTYVQLQLKNLVSEHEGRVCEECCYVLDGLPSVHQCPECGAPYDVRALQKSWSLWFSGDAQPLRSQRI